MYHRHQNSRHRQCCPCWFHKSYFRYCHKGLDHTKARRDLFTQRKKGIIFCENVYIWGNLLTSDTIHTWFQMITGLEQETLLVICGIIRDVEHGPEVTVFNLAAFSLARSEIHYIVVVNVDNIVQCDWASAISKWTKWIWFLGCWKKCK